MAFGKKKEIISFNQSNVAMLAAEALAKSRSVRVQLAVRLTFETPFLTQRWTSKAVRKMLGNMVGMPEPTTSKDLTKDYEESWYRNVNGVPIVPCRNIKASIVDGAPVTGDVVTKADLKRSLRVCGFTAPIIGATKTMDIKIVGNANGRPDFRARAMFSAGSYCDIVLDFGAPLTPDKVMSATEAAGAAIGLGEWRPEKGGELGRFTVEVLANDRATINKIMKANAVAEEEFVIPPEMLRAFNAIPDEKLPDVARKVRANARHIAEQRVNGAA